ncbi:Thioredoxin [seawater metagenome]|uniref:Thioredoxin n=1 Tax=seawater metagenome TaxID=1561972 RepID=A0A5E8CJB0_9ZZZZ
MIAKNDNSMITEIINEVGETCLITETGCNIVEVTDETFEEEVLKSEKPVLVDFWAPRCGPCKVLGPIIDEIAENTPYVKFVKVNVDVDNSQKTAPTYGIRVIPTLKLFIDGKIKWTQEGVLSKDVLQKNIDDNVQTK